MQNQFTTNGGNPIRECACGCGETFPTFSRWKKERRFISGHSGTKPGSRHIASNGYVKIKIRSHPDADPNGYVYEHRLVAERLLGRRLKHHEMVHHLNGAKADNRPENLKIVSSKAEHASNHSPKRDRILTLIGKGSITKRDLIAVSGLTFYAVTQHLTKLRKAGQVIIATHRRWQIAS